MTQQFVNFVRRCLVVCVCADGAARRNSTRLTGLLRSRQVVPTGDMSLVTVDKPDQFPLVAADQVEAAPELNVTGAVISGCCARGAGDLAGQRQGGGHQGAAGRLREEGPTAAEGAEPGQSPTRTTCI